MLPTGQAQIGPVRLAILRSLRVERVAAHLEAQPGITVHIVRTQEGAWAAADRQHAIKAAYRKDVGGMTREELMAQATTPEKREAAELLWSRMEERKLAAHSTPPP